MKLSKRVSGLVGEATKGVRKLIAQHEIKNILALFSGGKDSLVSTHIVWKAVRDSNINFEVIHIDTTCALPGVQDYVIQTSKRLGWPLKILRPKVDFWTLAEKWGAPTPRRRWCCYHLKLEPIREYTKTLKSPRLHILGLRAWESPSRLKKANSGKLNRCYWDRKSETWVYNPILWWRDRDIDEYIKVNKLPVNPTYEKVGTGGECFCGVFKTIREVLLVKNNYPDFFQKLVELESKFRNNGSLLYINSKRVYVRDL